MKTVRFVLPAFAIFAFVAAVNLIGCSKEEPVVLLQAQAVREQAINAETVTVRGVYFVNSKAGAVTRVRFSTPDAPASMLRHDFLGYHPEITVGLKAEYSYLYRWRHPNSDEGRYVTRLCVKTVEQKPICAYMND